MRLSFDPPERLSPEKHRGGTARGIVRVENGWVSFELFESTGKFFARYEGRFYHYDGRLWLSCDRPDRSVAHGKLPYRFHPFNPEAFR
jgi:hypothetical protein